MSYPEAGSPQGGVISPILANIYLHEVLDEWFAKELRGHYGYYGIKSNGWSLDRFRSRVVHAWKRWLGRRSQRGSINWKDMAKLLDRFPLPGPALSGRDLPA